MLYQILRLEEKEYSEEERRKLITLDIDDYTGYWKSVSPLMKHLQEWNAKKIYLC